MPYPLPESFSKTVHPHEEEELESQEPVSVGSGIAVAAICGSHMLLIGFLLVLNFTDVLHGSSTNREAAATYYPGAILGDILLWIFTLSPLYSSYKLCTNVLERG